MAHLSAHGKGFPKGKNWMGPVTVCHLGASMVHSLVWWTETTTDMLMALSWGVTEDTGRACMMVWPRGRRKEKTKDALMALPKDATKDSGTAGLTVLPKGDWWGSMSGCD